MRPLTEAFRTGEWKGRKAFVVGSGPSLKQFDRQHLRDQLTIGCNMEYKWRPTISLVQDPRLFAGDGSMKGLKDTPEWYMSGSWPVYFKGHPDREVIDASDFIYEAKSCHSRENPFQWGSDLEHGLTYGANVGLAALSLADVLGASPIYLLGFDCGFGPRRETHCHDQYPENWALPEKSQQEVFDRWVKEFDRHSKSVRGKVVCVGPSALTCFKKISMKELMEILL